MIAAAYVRDFSLQTFVDIDELKEVFAAAETLEDYEQGLRRVVVDIFGDERRQNRWRKLAAMAATRHDPRPHGADRLGAGRVHPPGGRALHRGEGPGLGHARPINPLAFAFAVQGLAMGPLFADVAPVSGITSEDFTDVFVLFHRAMTSRRRPLRHAAPLPSRPAWHRRGDSGLRCASARTSARSPTTSRPALRSTARGPRARARRGPDAGDPPVAGGPARVAARERRTARTASAPTSSSGSSVACCARLDDRVTRRGRPVVARPHDLLALEPARRGRPSTGRSPGSGHRGRGGPLRRGTRAADLFDQLFRWRPDVAERWLAGAEEDPRAALLRAVGGADRPPVPPDARHRRRLGSSLRGRRRGPRPPRAGAPLRRRLAPGWAAAPARARRPRRGSRRLHAPRRALACRASRACVADAAVRRDAAGATGRPRDERPLLRSVGRGEPRDGDAARPAPRATATSMTRSPATRDRRVAPRRGSARRCAA